MILAKPLAVTTPRPTARHSAFLSEIDEFSGINEFPSLIL
jgi:hypothetical protein